MLDKWSRKQNNLFNRYLRVKDGLSIDEAKSELVDTQEIWIKLYEILYRSGFPVSEYSRIENIRIISDRDNIYLVIDIFSNRHIVIDFVNKKSLSEAEIATRISSNDILNFIGEGSFSFEVINDEAVNDFIDLYMENREVYDKGPCLTYEINKGKDKGYFSMDLATQQIGLSFVSGEKVNYFFFQGDTVDGMSGDCDRRVAVNINDRINNILIPYSVVDRYKAYKDSMKLKKVKE